MSFPPTAQAAGRMLESPDNTTIGITRMAAFRRIFCLALTLFALPACAASGPAVAGIPVDFILFALTLLGVALFHNATLFVAMFRNAGSATAFFKIPSNRVIELGSQIVL